MSEATTVDELAAGTRAVARAGSAADIFKTLLEQSHVVAPRAAVYLVRRGEAQGWGSFGYPTEAAHSQRALRSSLDQGWLGELSRDVSRAPLVAVPEVDPPDFGQRAAGEAVGCAVRVGDRAIALIVAERDGGETPWLPEGLALLTSVAELRLELDLALRRAARTEPHAPARPGSGDPATSPAVSPAEPEAVTDEVPEDPATDTTGPDFEPARRYARLVATDIRLYNEEAVMLGRRNGDLSERIGEHLERGRETFLRRHAGLGPAALELLHEAYVQVLAAGDAALIPPPAAE